jgi:hypothetical protein
MAAIPFPFIFFKRPYIFIGLVESGSVSIARNVLGSPTTHLQRRGEPGRDNRNTLEFSSLATPCSDARELIHLVVQMQKELSYRFLPITTTGNVHLSSSSHVESCHPGREEDIRCDSAWRTLKQCNCNRPKRERPVSATKSTGLVMQLHHT